eukprot:bmy_16115T0
MLPTTTASLLGPLLTAWALLLPFTQGQSPNYTRPVFLCGGDVTGESGYLASEGFPNLYPANKECVWTITTSGLVLCTSHKPSALHPDGVPSASGPVSVGNAWGKRGALCLVVSRLTLQVPDPVPTIRSLRARLCPSPSESLTWSCTPPAVMTLWRMSQDLTLRTTATEATAGPPWMCVLLRAVRGAGGHAGGERGGRGERPGGGGRAEEVRGESSAPSAARGPAAQPPPLPRRQVISLTFGKFDLEPDSYCRYDSVSVFNGAVSDDAKRLGKFCGDTAPGPISSEGNELLVQFVSDLSVTADGFSASYRTLPRGATEGGPARSPGEDARPSPPLLGPGPKPGAGPKVKPEVPPEEKPKAAPKAEATPVGPDAPSVSCPKQCRRTGTLQSHFCNSDLVVTGMMKSMVRGPGEGLTVTVNLTGVYKTGGLDLPSPPTDTSLKFYVPCKQCPPMKKGISYLLMGQVEENRGPILPPESFVVLYRPTQHQILTNLSKRCPSKPVQAAGSQA